MTDLPNESPDEIEVSEEQLRLQELAFADLATCLRLQTEQAVAVEDWPKFQSQLSLSLDESVESLDFANEQALLSTHFEAAVSERGGQWTAFTERVIDQALRSEQQASRQPVQVQVVQELEGDIESTLDQLEPRFENQFYRELGNRIAQPSPSPWHRISAAVKAWLSPPSWAWGSLAVAMTAAFLFLSTPEQDNVNPMKVSSPNKVQVDAIQFEGTVTLSQSEDVTVIWLAEASG